jgi:hypothetical protein
VRLAVLAMLALAGCDNRPDQWDAFLYNESDDGSITEYTIKGFKTFELCQEAAQSELLRHGKGPVQDYECGHKCEYRAGLGLNVCEETRK